MKTEDLNYELPAELIAQQPGRVRSDSRLLVLSRKSGEIIDSRFCEIGNYLKKGDCLVLNNTKVLAARFFGHRKTGGKIEGLFLREIESGEWQVMLKGAQNVRPGEEIILEDKKQQDSLPAIMTEYVGQGRFNIRIESKLKADMLVGCTG